MRNLNFLRIMRLAGGFQESKILMTANDLDLFSEVSAGCCSGEDLAAKLQVNARALMILMNALVAMGLLRKENGCYRNTELADRHLVKNGSEYLGDFIKLMNTQWEGYGNLGEVVMTGYLNQKGKVPNEKNSSYVRSYIWGMDNMGRDRARRIARTLDLSLVNKMLDVGGGAATYSIEFAKRNPQLTSVVLDLPATLDVARENIGRNGVGDRVITQACSYWDMDYKSDFDLVWISQIIHGLGEKQVAELIQRSANAVAPKGRLIVHDSFLDEDCSSPYHAAVFSVFMLAVTEHGRCYSVKEVEQWINSAGLADVHRVPLDAETEMVVGVRP